MSGIDAPEHSVAVFAHDEADAIAGCLAALQAAGLGPTDPIFVLINGTTDATPDIVAGFAAKDPRIRPVVIALGDKANAWSYYVHRLAPPTARLHLFVDGDVRVSAGAVPAIEAALAGHPEALAAATLPQGGRTAPRWAERILRDHGMPGNFYALRGETLSRIRTLSVSMPVGLIGDDPLLRWLLLHDFTPNGPVDRSLIRPVPEAHFSYQSIPMTGLSGLRALVARQLRYQMRDLQMNLLIRHLKVFGLGAMPRRIDSLYDAATPMLALRGQFKLRKLAFLYTYLKARGPQPRIKSGSAWYEA
ncbi:MAG: glycosyltransferase [Defluviimonas sp.]|uniref:glycosyltransferase n=1 Tax=Albidovulum sp. TaxID=1872424 RepID=UPI002A2A4260|nr:glycosyltransferase [Defluviimonas sp.]